MFREFATESVKVVGVAMLAVSTAGLFAVVNGLVIRYLVDKIRDGMPEPDRVAIPSGSRCVVVGGPRACTDVVVCWVDPENRDRYFVDRGDSRYGYEQAAHLEWARGRPLQGTVK